MTDTERFYQLISWMVTELKSCGSCTVALAIAVIESEAGRTVVGPPQCLNPDRRERTCYDRLKWDWKLIPQRPKEPTKEKADGKISNEGSRSVQLTRGGEAKAQAQAHGPAPGSQTVRRNFIATPAGAKAAGVGFHPHTHSNGNSGNGRR